MALLHALAQFGRAKLPKLNVVARLQRIPVDRHEHDVDLENLAFHCPESLKKVDHLDLELHLLDDLDLHTASST